MSALTPEGLRAWIAKEYILLAVDNEMKKDLNAFADAWAQDRDRMKPKHIERPPFKYDEPPALCPPERSTEMMRGLLAELNITVE